MARPSNRIAFSIRRLDMMTICALVSLSSLVIVSASKAEPASSGLTSVPPPSLLVSCLEERKIEQSCEKSVPSGYRKRKSFVTSAAPLENPLLVIVPRNKKGRIATTRNASFKSRPLASDYCQRIRGGSSTHQSWCGKLKQLQVKRQEAYDRQLDAYIDYLISMYDDEHENEEEEETKEIATSASLQSSRRNSDDEKRRQRRKQRKKSKNTTPKKKSRSYSKNTTRVVEARRGGHQEDDSTSTRRESLLDDESDYHIDNSQATVDEQPWNHQIGTVDKAGLELQSPNSNFVGSGGDDSAGDDDSDIDGIAANIEANEENDAVLLDQYIEFLQEDLERDQALDKYIDFVTEDFDIDQAMDQYIDFLLATTNAKAPNCKMTEVELQQSTQPQAAQEQSQRQPINLAITASISNANAIMSTETSNIVNAEKIVVVVPPTNEELDAYIDNLVTAVELDEYIDRLVSSVSSSTSPEPEAKAQSLVADEDEVKMRVDTMTLGEEEEEDKSDALVDSYVNNLVSASAATESDVEANEVATSYLGDESSESKIAVSKAATSYSKEKTATEESFLNETEGITVATTFISKPRSSEEGPGTRAASTVESDNFRSVADTAALSKQDAFKEVPADDDDDFIYTKHEDIDIATAKAVSGTSTSATLKQKRKVIAAKDEAKSDSDAVEDLEDEGLGIAVGVAKDESASSGGGDDGDNTDDDDDDYDDNVYLHASTFESEPAEHRISSDKLKASEESTVLPSKPKKRMKRKVKASGSGPSAEAKDSGRVAPQNDAESVAASKPRPDEGFVSPNGLYRFLLRQGPIGHVLVLALVLFAEWLRLYMPQIADIFTLLWLKTAPMSLQRRMAPQKSYRGDGRASPSNLQQIYSGRMPVRGKQRKRLSKQADEEALAKLQRIGDIQDSKYKHISVAFMRRHGLGPYRNDDGAPVEEDAYAELVASVEPTLKRKKGMKRKKKLITPSAADDGESDVDWIVAGLSSDTASAKSKRKPAFDTSLSFCLGSSGPTMEVGLEYGVGEKSLSAGSRRQVSLDRDAITRDVVRKKPSRPRQSDRNGVMGRIRAVASSNNLMSRNLLGAYPGDLVPPSEAASARGVADLARKYGYGEWSDDDDWLRDDADEDGSDDNSEGTGTNYSTSRGRKRRRKRKKSTSRDSDAIGFGNRTVARSFAYEASQPTKNNPQNRSRRQRSSISGSGNTKSKLIRPSLKRLNEATGSVPGKQRESKSDSFYMNLDEEFKSRGTSNKNKKLIRPALERLQDTAETDDIL